MAVATIASFSPPPSPPSPPSDPWEEELRVAGVRVVLMEPDEMICSSEDTVIIDAAINYYVKPTNYPEGDHSFLNATSLLLVSHHRLDWQMDDTWFSALQPPPCPRGAHSEKERRRCCANTEVLGRYLIERGFPLIGIGRFTLAFLITENKVAKVARYARVFDAEWRNLEPRYEDHRRERNLDVRHSQNHPAAFARTTYHLVMPVTPGKNSWFDYTAWRHDLYMQELVTPLARAPDFHARSFQETYPNWRRVIEMLNANPNTPFKQWGLTDSNMLVCYDYQ